MPRYILVAIQWTFYIAILVTYITGTDKAGDNVQLSLL